jgi:hypothetical protein
MPPEQAAGRLEELGPASDVYSLGATLYCLLTGHAPVQGKDGGEVLRRVQRGEFPPPRQVKSGVPAALEAVCLKAMALRPEQRYGSARALADDVEHWLADEPVSAWREPVAVRCGRWAKRHRAWLLASSVLLLMVSLLSVTTALVVNNARQREKAALQRVRELAAESARLSAALEKAQGDERAALERRLQEKVGEIGVASQAAPNMLGH